MKIRISDIPHTGLTIEDKLALEPMNERMAQGRGQDIRFTVAPEVSLIVTKTMTGAELRGTIRTRIAQQCSRCCEPVERQIEVPIDTILQAKDGDLAGNPDSSGQEEDIGVLYYEGDHVDLEELLQESIILTLSLYWSPECDAKGNCSLCFKGLPVIEEAPASAKNSLGSLLKKVGLKG